MTSNPLIEKEHFMTQQNNTIRRLLVKTVNVHLNPSNYLFRENITPENALDEAEAQIEQEINKAVVEELGRIYDKTPPENGMGDVIADRIAELTSKGEKRCVHDERRGLLISNPPQYICMNCDKTWIYGSQAPICDKPNQSKESK